MQRLFISFVLVAYIVLAAGAYAQQPPKEQQLPNELVQYVSDARKAGINENQIQQNAVNAGWPAEMVQRAIADAFQAPAGKATPPVPDTVATPAAKSNEPAPAGLQAEPAAAKATEPPPGKAAPVVAAPVAKPNEQALSPAATAAPPGKPAVEPGGGTVPVAVDHGVPDDYEIGAGDELQISVWREPDASVTAVVRPDGKISMPMLKEVSVIGLTPTQAEKLITDQLVKFISAADVTVIVKAINSKKIYVVGGVKREGPIPYTYRMTILQALSEAGGISDYAKKKKIYVLRHEKGRDYQLPFDYDAALRGEKMELNIPLFPGDTLVVPK
jgi:polysaccharide biosynthesis/export protein